MATETSLHLGLPANAGTHYVRAVIPGTGGRQGPGQRRLRELIEFRSWMLALALFLACAIGIAVMEGLREGPQVVAQAAEVPAR